MRFSLSNRDSVNCSFRKLAKLTFAIGIVITVQIVLAQPAGATIPLRPTVSRVFPAGGARGNQVEVNIQGTHLDKVIAARFSTPGISSEIVEIKDSSNVKIRVNIPHATNLGDCDLRLLTSTGVSNRLIFAIGDLPECNETEPNSQIAEAQKLTTLPTLINGDISNEDQDFYRFSAKAGEVFVFELNGRHQRPYLKIDDRVGWFDPCLTLFDASGRELQFMDDFREDPDPVLIHKFENDGEYVIAVRDNMYRGRSEFVYRLRMGVLPYITHAFPLGWHRQSDAIVQIFGANVPSESHFKFGAETPSAHSIHVINNGLQSNPYPFAINDLPELVEASNNDDVKTAQRITAPVVVNARIEKPNDLDCFVFAASKGQQVVAEVASSRFGSPLDSIVQILSSQGNELTSNDDAEGTAMQLHRADARLSYAIPADGDYVVRVRDFLNRGGEEYAYRLMLAPPTPSFELELAIDNPYLDQGSHSLITVNMARKDGFDGEVILFTKDLPTGIVASGAKIGKGQSSTVMTLTATAEAPLGAATFPLKIFGRDANVPNGPEVAVRGTENLEYVTSQYQKIPVADCVLAVTPVSVPFSMTAASNEILLVKEQPNSLKVNIDRRPGVVGAVTLTLQGLPANVNAPGVTIPPEQSEGTIVLTAAAGAAIGSTNIVVDGKITLENQVQTQFSRAVSCTVQ